MPTKATWPKFINPVTPTCRFRLTALIAYTATKTPSPSRYSTTAHRLAHQTLRSQRQHRHQQDEPDRRAVTHCDVAESVNEGPEVDPQDQRFGQGNRVGGHDRACHTAEAPDDGRREHRQ